MYIVRCAGSSITSICHRAALLPSCVVLTPCYACSPSSRRTDPLQVTQSSHVIHQVQHQLRASPKFSLARVAHCANTCSTRTRTLARVRLPCCSAFTAGCGFPCAECDCSPASVPPALWNDRRCPPRRPCWAHPTTHRAVANHARWPGSPHRCVSTVIHIHVPVMTPAVFLRPTGRHVLLPPLCLDLLSLSSLPDLTAFSSRVFRCIHQLPFARPDASSCSAKRANNVSIKPDCTSCSERLRIRRTPIIIQP